MTDPAWHLAAEQIDRYAALTLSPSAEASVEAHLEACARCRADVASSAAVTDLTPRLERTWTATADRIDAPPAGWLERLAGLVGVPDHLARLIGVSGAFRTAWLTSVLLAMVAGLGAASGDLPPVLFLLLSILQRGVKMRYLFALSVMAIGLFLSFSRAAWAHMVFSAAMMMALLFVTTASVQFSISMPATLLNTSLLRTRISRLLPT